MTDALGFGSGGADRDDGFVGAPAVVDAVGSAQTETATEGLVVAVLEEASTLAEGGGGGAGGGRARSGESLGCT